MNNIIILCPGRVRVRVRVVGLGFRVRAVESGFSLTTVRVLP